jgi:hypothetical protein
MSCSLSAAPPWYDLDLVLIEVPSRAEKRPVEPDSYNTGEGS